MIASIKRSAVISLTALTLSTLALAAPASAAGSWHGHGGGRWHGGGWGAAGVGLAAGAVAGAALAAPYYYGDSDPGYPTSDGSYGYAPEYPNSGCYAGASMYNGC